MSSVAPKKNYKITLKVRKSDGRLFIPRRTEKRFLTRLACLANLKEAYLKVEYLPGYYNEFICRSKPEFLQALNAATEKELLDYLYS